MADSNDKKKYEPLGSYLASLPVKTSNVTLTFAEVANIIGDTLPPSAFRYREWWSNQEGGSRAPHWRSAGFRVADVNFERQTVRFERVTPAKSEPRAMTLQEVVTEVNASSVTRSFGHLQEWRKEHKGLERLPLKTPFFASPKGNTWAMHFGGRSELQFNLGFDQVEGARVFRHGVAFSLEPSRSLSGDDLLERLVPKIVKFNEYLRAYPDAFADFEMWMYDAKEVRSDNHPVAPIPDAHVTEGSFIFLGATQPVDAIRVDIILDDFDRLLPLYEFVEGSGAVPVQIPERERGHFIWPTTDDESNGRTETAYRRSERTVEVSLRHNVVQTALLSHLRDVYGAKNAVKELPTADGTSIDLAVRDGDAFIYYELKTYSSAQACIREAIGQLLEYSLWPGAKRAAQLVIVGEAPLDDKAKAYVSHLREAFSLPIEYQQFDMATGRLVKK